MIGVKQNYIIQTYQGINYVDYKGCKIVLDSWLLERGSSVAIETSMGGEVILAEYKNEN